MTADDVPAPADSAAETGKTSTEVIVFDAKDGDCVLIRCLGVSRFNILIDGGRAGTELLVEQYLKGLPEAEQKIDLFVVTHLDSDHIAGAIAIAGIPFLAERIDVVWFNGPTQIAVPKLVQDLSFTEANRFCEAIARNGWRWNEYFGGGAVARSDASCPQIDATDRVSLTVLAPTEQALERLGTRWNETIAEQRSKEDGPHIVHLGSTKLDVAALASQPYLRDTGMVNASSIGLIVRHGCHSVLMTADCPAEVLADALPLLTPAGSLKVDICKFPHHGSGSNFSPNLAAKVEADHWFVTANGRHGHPDAASIARMLVASKVRPRSPVTLSFTNSHPQAAIWKNAALAGEYQLTTVYRAKEEGWLMIRPKEADA